MKKNTAAYICWDETESTLKGETINGREWEHITVTRRARWSADTSPESIDKAKRYISDNMDDGRKNVRVEIVKD